MDFYPPPAPVREGPTTYQKLLVPLRSKQTPDKDVVMLSPSPKSGATSTRPVFSSDDFIPFSLDDTRSNKKRERGEEENTQQPEVNPYLVRPVWVDPSIDVSGLSLTQELAHFCQWISLTEEEDRLREHAVQLIRDIVKTLWPAARVEIYGSHFTKIALPFSDVDLMIYKTSGDDPLSRLCSEISEKYATEFVLIKLIPSAKVPILKLTTKLGEVKLDISVAFNDEPPNSVKIAEYLQKQPVLRPLVITLKQFLQQFLLNDTYTGGAGSYLLTLMSISLLQFRENPRSPAFLGTGGNSISHFGQSNELGYILLEFFELYGRIFNYHKHGISVRGNGSYFSKQERGWFQPHAPQLLSIEDPSDPENDVGRGSFNMMQVRLVFFQAFVRLTHPDTERTMPNYKVSSLLTRVIDMDPIYLSRRQRAKMIGATLQNRQSPTDDDKSDISELSEQSEQSEKSEQSDSYIPPQAITSIMVGDKHLEDLDPLTISRPSSLSSAPIEIDEREVEVIDLNSDDESVDEGSVPSPSLVPPPFTPNVTLPSTSTPSLPRPILANSSLSSSSSSSSVSSSASSNTLSTSPNASKAYSNGISNVIVNNHSRSPNGHSHYSPNFTSNYNSNFNSSNYNPNFSTANYKPKNKVRPTHTHKSTANTNTNNTHTHANESTNTNNINDPNVNKKPNKKNKNRFNKQKPNPKNNFAPSIPSTTSTSSTSTISAITPNTNQTSSGNSTNTTTHTTSTTSTHAPNSTNTTSTNAGNPGNAANAANRNNNLAVFSPGKRRKY
eukprot:Phypoly_transcript_03298.p1 GENE.Phypoly_transcript_03298~~Phypoly_transcript_03298.p1  ORF type:complete len:780 (+),score=171.11 Phypoly_transcript_03298:121-2460(+)